MPLTSFHPASSPEWFNAHFDAPSDVQRQAWPAIRAGESTLIAAPTGSGKTLAAFLAAIDQLVQQGLESPLPDETRILYISPLKALSNDIHKNLELPLDGIRFALLEHGLPDVATPCPNPHRRYFGGRTRGHEAPSAAYSGDYPGIALYFAHLGFRTRNAEFGAQRYRR